MSNAGETQDRQAVIKRALVELKQMQARLDAAERARTEPIAIVGMGCRVPGGADDPASYWRLLDAGVDATGEIPPGRWDRDAFYDAAPDAPGKMSTRRGGFLAQVDGFDAEFFGISPREAASMDPQQRLLLEVGWEALEDAGQAPDRLAGSRTGVFVGIGIDDYKQLQLGSGDPERIDAYSGTGTLLCVAAGRISYVLGLRGPCLSVDTGCSSSLVALHLACQSLRADECSMALVGGVHLMLAPEMSVFLSKARALSPEGRCKTFDSSADGYARAEGCGVIVLKRLSRALEDGDPIRALIRGSAVNHDGRSSGLTVPNGLAQQALIREALERAGVSPARIGYVEAHGTGTPLGDPIEVQALAAVLGEGRPADRPLRLGSAKTNLGHLEAAAGIAGLIKVVLSLEHGRIPPHLHMKAPSPRIPWDELPLVVPTEGTPWPQGAEPRLAGVSSFGISGTNAHAIVEEAPAHAAQAAGSAVDPAPEAHLLPLSARSPSALRALAEAYQGLLAGPDAPSVADVCATAANRRAHMEHRLAVVGRSREELASGLGAFTRGEARQGLSSGHVTPGVRRKLVFVFPGQGSQWLGMGRQLLAQEPAFAAALSACDAAVRAHAGWSILDELAADEASARLTHIDVVQPLLFAMQVALSALWRSWGISPDAVVGHSMGEIAAAHVSGALSLDDAARIVCRRSALLSRVSGRGAMAMVELSLAQAERALEGYEDRLSIAVSNGPRSTVLSGDPAALEAVLERLRVEGVFCRAIKVNVASHSPQMDPLRSDLLAALRDLRPQAADIPMVSTVTGALQDLPDLDASYWVRNLREPVLFWPAVQRLLEDGHSLFVEVSPHPVLLPSIEQEIQRVGAEAVALPSLRHDEPERQSMLGSLGALHALGCAVDWSKVEREGRFTRLPTYPWQRKRHWIEPQRRVVRGAGGGHPLLGKRIRSALEAVQFEVELHADCPSFLGDHVIHGAVVVPGASHVAMSLCAAAALGSSTCVLERVSFIQALVLQENEPRAVQLVLTGEPGQPRELQVLSTSAAEDSAEPSWTRHATATLSLGLGASAPTDAEDLLEAARGRCAETVTGEAFYRDFWAAGYQLGPSFRWIRALHRRDGEALARLEVAEGAEDVEHYPLHPTLIDACFQMACAALPGGLGFILAAGAIYVPFSVQRFELHARPSGPLWCHATVRESDARGEIFSFDLRVLDDAGRSVARIDGLHLKRARRELLLGTARDSFYEVAWELSPLASAAARPAPAERGAFLILADRGGVGHALAAELERRGERCVLVDPPPLGAALARVEALRQLLADRFRKEQAPYRGVLHFWSLDVPDAAQVEAASLDAAQTLVCDSVLLSIQAMSAARWRDMPRLWLFSRGAQVVGAPREPVSIAAAPLWGLGRVIPYEHPELRCARVDLGHAEAKDEIRALADEVLADGDEDQIALRPEGRHVARLARRSVGSHPAAIRPDATYLLTGGLGALGLLCARWLVDRGARHLVLVGRSGPSDAARDAVRAMENAGANVRIASADVASEERMAALLDDVRRTMPPLRGVLHAACVLDDGTLLQQSPERFRAVMAPKVRGAWNLHTLTRGAPLDFFVLFSSVASLLGVPGQGNYAAANAFLDALAHHRRSLGLPGQSIQWGPWAEVGLAAAQANRGERLATRGLASIEPEQGLEAFGRLLGDSGAQVGVLSLDLRQWRQFYVAVTTAPFFKRLEEPGARVGAGAGQARFVDALRAAEPGTRRALLETHLREQIGRVLRLPPDTIQPATPLGTLGLDSLMTLEIRNRLEASLGLSLSAMLVWGYPSVAALTEHLLDKLGMSAEPLERKPAAEGPRPEEARAALTELADDAMAALLAEELAAAKRKRRSR
ncbi:type I polyketide synthase [Polyangium aurulentum]|uniref:type I polyketide synthase n=1 Tax=Polyangium aurulentum TaxID=2567896 RepID=UPI0010ADB225|nr:type I polyketide synthase [Polyangium aurulentum]UQA57021.1 type I polyketide synthase [Polyangium aurulentum]